MNEWSANNEPDKVSTTWTCLAEMFGPKLTRAYGVSVPDAWRRAITSLKQHEITRGLQRLLDRGLVAPPTLPQFVKACKELGGDTPMYHSQQSALPKPEYSEPIHAHAQKCLFAYLGKRGAASEVALKAMITEKNRLVAQFCEVFTEDKTLTGGEIRDALFKAWDKLWQPMPQVEADRHTEHFRRTGYAADWMAPL